MSAGPIFIVGAPRSGTTLLLQMLRRHPRIAISGETHFLEVAYQERRRRVFGDLSQQANRERLIQAYLATRRAKLQLQMDFTKLAEKLLREGDSWRDMFAAILQGYAEAQGKPRWGEKTPQHALFTETFLQWFPDAAVLHILRDPRDVVASLLHRPAASASAVTNARAWLRLNQAARRCSGRPGYREVRYETLVAQPEEELRKICEFLGEEYSPLMLLPEQQRVEHSGGMDRFRTPLTRARLGLWRKELSSAQAAQIEWALGDQMEAFGYAREMPRATAMTIWRGAAFSALDMARMAVERLPALWYYYMAPTDLANYERWRFPPPEDEPGSAGSANAVKSIGT
jgi:hypothetical protein